MSINADLPNITITITELEPPKPQDHVAITVANHNNPTIELNGKTFRHTQENRWLYSAVTIGLFAGSFAFPTYFQSVIPILPGSITIGALGSVAIGVFANYFFGRERTEHLQMIEKLNQMTIATVLDTVKSLDALDLELKKIQKASECAKWTVTYKKRFAWIPEYIKAFQELAFTEKEIFLILKKKGFNPIGIEASAISFLKDLKCSMLIETIQDKKNPLDVLKKRILELAKIAEGLKIKPDLEKNLARTYHWIDRLREFSMTDHVIISLLKKDLGSSFELKAEIAKMIKSINLALFFCEETSIPIMIHKMESLKKMADYCLGESYFSSHFEPLFGHLQTYQKLGCEAAEVVKFIKTELSLEKPTLQEIYVKTLFHEDIHQVVYTSKTLVELKEKLERMCTKALFYKVHKEYQKDYANLTEWVQKFHDHPVASHLALYALRLRYSNTFFEIEEALKGLNLDHRLLSANAHLKEFGVEVVQFHKKKKNVRFEVIAVDTAKTNQVVIRPIEKSPFLKYVTHQVIASDHLIKFEWIKYQLFKSVQAILLT